MDEPRGARGDAPDGDGRSPSLLDRARRRLRSVVESVSIGQRCLDWFDTRGQDRPQSQIHTDGFADNVVPPPECPPVDGLPRRSRPFTYPTRNHAESNPVDLVSVEAGNRLTVTHPDNPDAKISSDVWESVEE